MEDIKIGFQFEYEEVLYCYKPDKVENRFVTVLDAFKHHYTGQEMFYIRLESVCSITERGTVEYKTVRREELDEMIRSKPGNHSKKFRIAYRMDKVVHEIAVKGFDNAQFEVEFIMNHGGDVLGVKEETE